MPPPGSGRCERRLHGAMSCWANRSNDSFRSWECLPAVAHSTRPSRDDRFLMLDTIREYALERLEEQGARDQTTRALVNLVMLIERGFGALRVDPPSGALRGLLDAELDNIRVVIDWALGAQESELALLLAVEARIAPRCLPPEQGRWFDEGLRSASSASPRTRAAALHHAGGVALILGDEEKASALAEESLRLYRDLDDEVAPIPVLNLLGSAASVVDDHSGATAFYKQSLSLATQYSDTRGCLSGVAWAGRARTSTRESPDSE
jgi:hypothetical protein